MAEDPVAPAVPDDRGPSLNARLAAVLAIFVLLGATLFQVYRAGAAGDGRIKSFTYTQDAAYEQLVIGRELARGVEKGSAQYRGATPLIASGSPGWSLLMGFLLGLPSLSPESGRSPDEVALVPLVVNLVSAALLIAVVGHLVSGVIRSGFAMFAFLAAVGLFLPLPLLVMSGLTHVLHMAVVLLTVAVGLRSLDREEASVGLTLGATLLNALNVSLRFESLAISLGVLLWAWVVRRAGRSAISFLAGVGVVVAVMAYLHAHGGADLPNPMLVHAGMVLEGSWRHWPVSVLEHAGQNLHRAIFVWSLLGMGVVLLVLLAGARHSPDPLERRRVGWLFVFVFTATAHLLVGQTDAGGFRHSAYLIPLGAVAIVRALGGVNSRATGGLSARVCTGGQAASGTDRGEPKPARESGVGPTAEGSPPRLAPSAYRGAALVALVCVVPLCLLGMAEISGFSRAPQAARDAYVRDRLAASFVRTYFPSGPVAANETGLLGYETHARLVDLSGGTDRQVALARYNGSYDSNRVASEVAKAGGPVALVFATGRPVPVPQTWKQIGGWQRVGTARDSGSAVAVYSVSTALENDVRIALRLFSEQPRDGVDFWFAEQPPAAVKKES